MAYEYEAKALPPFMTACDMDLRHTRLCLHGVWSSTSLFPFIPTRVIWLRHMCRRVISCKGARASKEKEKKGDQERTFYFPFSRGSSANML
jgi:hypothetical protein